MRILVMGNSGAGKSTCAAWLRQRWSLAALDLDTVVWEPGLVAVARSEAAVAASLAEFRANHPAWVIEGCYGDWIERLLPFSSALLFLNPGIDTCLAHNRSRPWEPHKYASKAQQDAMLDGLQSWVAAYATREDAWSYAAHRRVFDGFAGRKHELGLPGQWETIDFADALDSAPDPAKG